MSGLEPGFETRKPGRQRGGVVETRVRPLLTANGTIVWNAFGHIIVQYKDMNMQDARDPPKNRKPRIGYV